MIEVQRDLHERAIAGEFAPDRLDELKKTLRDKGFEHLHKRHNDNEAAGESTSGRSIPKEWDTIHPGSLDDDDDDDDE